MTALTDHQAAPATTRLAAASITNGTKIYGDGDTRVVALDDVTERFEPACFTAIMGPSGSGKSTLLHCLAGLESLTSGRVEIDGTSLDDLGDKALTRLRRDRIGFVFQSFNLVPTLTAAENIHLPLAIARVDPDEQWATTVTETLGLADRLTHTPAELSGGQQQRVAVARALMSRPAIILADEPSGNLDSRSGAEVLGFLRRAVDEFGQSIVMVTHDPQAAASADRVVFLDDGRIVDQLHGPTVSGVLERMMQFGD